MSRPRFFLVELFSGTGSFSKAAKQAAAKLGYNFKQLSVDIHPKYNPTTCIDLRKWDYQTEIDSFLPAQLKPSDVVWVHASPPCNEYSRSKSRGVRDLPFADSLVKQALRIIKFTQPTFWTLENPVGLLHTRPFMQKLERFKNHTSYCKWGRPFRKNTHIWSNVPVDLPECRAGDYCKAKATLGQHPCVAETRDTHLGSQEKQSQETLYGIPPKLTRHVVRTALTLPDRERPPS
jgi:hypothetical protein